MFVTVAVFSRLATARGPACRTDHSSLLSLPCRQHPPKDRRAVSLGPMFVTVAVFPGSYGQRTRVSHRPLFVIFAAMPGSIRRRTAVPCRFRPINVRHCSSFPGSYGQRTSVSHRPLFVTSAAMPGSIRLRTAAPCRLGQCSSL